MGGRGISYDNKLEAVSKIQAEGSQVEICKRYSIRCKKQLQDWIMLYNGHKDLRTTGGQGRGIYMTKGRVTTLDEGLKLFSSYLTPLIWLFPNTRMPTRVAHWSLH